MNILQIGKFYPPYKGGMETVLKDLSEGFSGQGNSTRVICSNDCNKLEHIKSGKLEIYKYPTLKVIASQPICPSLWVKLKYHMEWADIIHVHSPNPIIEVIVLLIGKSKKIVCTHHSDIHRQKLLRIVYSPFWNLFKRKVSRFIVPTKNHIKYSNMINDVANKSSIIPFGIKDLNYKETTDIVLPFKKYLLFVGRLVEYKGLKYLLSSIKSTEYNLIIIGRGPLKEELEDKIREYKLQKQVTILTNINEQKDLNTIYKNAFAFVLPSISKNENFGMVQLEAMYFKLPIITTNIKSGVPSVGIPGESTILVSPKNSKELRDAFHKLYNEKGLASRMGMRGHELFKSKYTYENMINKHIENFQEIINEI